MNTFPILSGLNWDIKKRVVFSNASEESASGAQYVTSRWPSSLPHYEFDLVFEYLSQPDRDTLESFYRGQVGNAVPFLLSVTNDSAQIANPLVGVVNGINTAFQMTLPAQTNVVTSSLFDNGAPAGAATVTATGQVTFTAAPLAGHVMTYNCTYAYVVKFKDPEIEFGYLWSGAYEQQGITFRTFR